MKKKCDCVCFNFYNTFILNLDYLMKLYTSLLEMKNKKIKSEKEKKSLVQTYESIIDLANGLLIQGEESIEPLKKCKNDHKKEISDMEYKFNKLKEYPEKAKKIYEEINNLIPDDLDNEKEEEDEKYNKVINQINELNNNSENLSEKEKMKNNLKVSVLISDLLNDKEIQEKHNEEIKNIKKVANILDEQIKGMQVQLNQDDENIEHIENNVIEGFELVDKGDIELMKAAEHAVKRRRVGYQVGLAATFCAIGSVVPGIGNVIGAALGGLVGYGLYKIDEKRLKNVQKEYFKQKNDEKDKFHP